MGKRKYILTLEDFKNSKINESTQEKENAIKALHATHSILLSDYPNDKYFIVHDLYNGDNKRLTYISCNKNNDVEGMDIDTESYVIFNGRDAYHLSLTPEYVAKDINSKSSIVYQAEGNNDLYTKINDFNETFDELLEGGNITSNDIDDMINFIDGFFDDYYPENVSYGEQRPEIDK